MTKYAVMIVLDLDVVLEDNKKVSEVEKATENLVRIYFEGEESRTKIKILRTKFLGLAEMK